MKKLVIAIDVSGQAHNILELGKVYTVRYVTDTFFKLEDESTGPWLKTRFMEISNENIVNTSLFKLILK